MLIEPPDAAAFPPAPTLRRMMIYGEEHLPLGLTVIDTVASRTAAQAAAQSVEQPMRFELVVNPKTAKTLGVTIPQSVLLRADDVIQ